jgi:hypothetical protein
MTENTEHTSFKFGKSALQMTDERVDVAQRQRLDNALIEVKYWISVFHNFNLVGNIAKNFT